MNFQFSKSHFVLSSGSDQLQTLLELVNKAQNTDFGRRHNFDDIHTFEAFREHVPIHFYGDIESGIEKLKQGTADVFWPGPISSFAVSAGTTGKGKHLPLSESRLTSDRLFMRKVVQSYFRQRPNVFSLWGKHISLPGSINTQENLRLGEISGFTALGAPSWLTPFQLIDPKKLASLSFKEKFELILEQARKADIRVISAAPSWVLTLFQEVLDRSGKNSIAELWPNLKLLVCGGAKLANYRPHLEQLFGRSELDFIETYGASEGYFAYSDNLIREDLKLVTNNGIFYEFIPDPLPDEQALSIQDTVPLSEVKPGVPYGMIVTTNAGLWRYAVRDIIEFTSVDPPRILVKGRLSEMLDDYGEGLYAYEAEEAIQQVANKMNLQVATFTITSKLDSERHIPRHHWFVQFIEPIHRQTLNRMEKSIDQHLQSINRHYAIRRETNALASPILRDITQEQINHWLKDHDKDKAQGKLPRILKDHTDLEIFE